MFNVGGLLAVANGALEGAQQNRDVAYERGRQQRLEQRQDLDDLVRLSQVPGVSLGDPAAGTPAAPAPHAPAAPGGVLGAAAQAAAGAPNAPNTAPSVLPNAAPSPAPAPASTRRQVGTVGGQAVGFDPALTATGLHQAALARDRAAYEQLHAAHPDEYPVYETGGGYEHLAAAVEPQHVVMTQVLRTLKNADGTPRFSPEEAEQFAHFNEFPALQAVARATAQPKLDPNGGEATGNRVRVVEARADATGRARVKYGTGRGGGAAKPPTVGNQNKVADNLVAAYGSADAAAQSGDPKLAQLGLTVTDLRAAEARAAGASSRQVAGLAGKIATGTFSSPDSAVGVAQQIVRGARSGRASGGGAGGASGLPPRAQLQSKYDNAYNHLRGQGKTDAQITATIGPRP